MLIPVILGGVPRLPPPPTAPVCLCLHPKGPSGGISMRKPLSLCELICPLTSLFCGPQTANSCSEDGVVLPPHVCTFTPKKGIRVEREKSQLGCSIPKSIPKPLPTLHPNQAPPPKKKKTQRETHSHTLLQTGWRASCHLSFFACLQRPGRLFFSTF